MWEQHRIYFIEFTKHFNFLHKFVKQNSYFPKKMKLNKYKKYAHYNFLIQKIVFCSIKNILIQICFQINILRWIFHLHSVIKRSISSDIYLNLLSFDANYNLGKKFKHAHFYSYVIFSAITCFIFMKIFHLKKKRAKNTQTYFVTSIYNYIWLKFSGMKMWK